MQSGDLQLDRSVGPLGRWMIRQIMHMILRNKGRLVKKSFLRRFTRSFYAVAGQAHQRAMSTNGYLLAGQEILFQSLQNDARYGVLQVRLVLCYLIKGLLVTFHQRPDCVLI